MNIKTIALDRDKARDLFDRYKSVPKSRKTPEDEAIQSALRQVGQGKIVLDIFSVFRQTGLNDDAMPKLAICRADTEKTFLVRRADGSAFFCPVRWDKHSSKTIALPSGTFSWRWTDGGTQEDSPQCSAMAPLIPAYLRPQHKLQNYHLLWEAVWTPDPPCDPYLLRKLHGALYVVLAEWDLSEIEMAAMRGRVRMG